MAGPLTGDTLLELLEPSPAPAESATGESRSLTGDALLHLLAPAPAPPSPAILERP